MSWPGLEERQYDIWLSIWVLRGATNLRLQTTSRGQVLGAWIATVARRIQVWNLQFLMFCFQIFLISSLRTSPPLGKFVLKHSSQTATRDLLELELIKPMFQVCKSRASLSNVRAPGFSTQRHSVVFLSSIGCKGGRGPTSPIL